ncbi:hypothetical protein KPC_1323 [Acinetobacter stercoris]|uniref:Uncharacterized protein n=1 Tax=Acinetobacter stercoris TaxID=2126983 RepID=A0A2U3MXN2_9GAMM|nr:hypothetical protein KPC_1323 [Acinetobacter stercoris]
MTVKIFNDRILLNSYERLKSRELHVMSFKHIKRLVTKKNDANYFCSSFFISKVLFTQVCSQFLRNKCAMARVGYFPNLVIIRLGRYLHRFIFTEKVFSERFIPRLRKGVS